MKDKSNPKAEKKIDWNQESGDPVGYPISEESFLISQPKAEKKIIYMEQVWEDESGNYHDEYAEVISIRKDGALQLKFLNVSPKTQEWLQSMEFYAKDYEKELNHD